MEVESNMTLSDLHNAVGQLLPDDCRFDVTLAIRRHAPFKTSYRKPEEQVEVVVEIDVWTKGRFESIDAPTYEAAFNKFRYAVIPALKLDNPATVSERLAEMDGAIEQVAELKPSGDVTVRCG